MGMGILLPVIPRLLQDMTAQSAAQASIYGGWLTALFAAVQFLAAPVLGALSDRLGRRPILLASLGAFGCSYILIGWGPNLIWLFVAQSLTGLFGATPSAAGAYIADVTEPADRTRHFGSMSAAFGLGLIIGPAIGGFLVEHGTRLPFFAAAALSVFTVAYGYLVLPESPRCTIAGNSPGCVPIRLARSQSFANASVSLICWAPYCCGAFRRRRYRPSGHTSPCRCMAGVRVTSVIPLPGMA